MYAYHKKYFNENEPILFFDMGEGDITIAKAKVISNSGFNGVIIDAQDGHLLPIEIGGDDIDFLFCLWQGSTRSIGQVAEIFSHFTFLISQMHCPLVPKIMLIYM